MKIVSFFICTTFLLAAILSFSFKSNAKMETTNPINLSTEDSTKVYDYADVEPEFPGGEDAMIRFLQTNIRYPAVAIQNGEQGKVYVRCIIDRDGSISNVEIAKGASPALNKESIRVVSAMPNWRPGSVKDEYVRTRIVLPIVYKIDVNEVDQKLKNKKSKKRKKTK